MARKKSLKPKFAALIMLAITLFALAILSAGALAGPQPFGISTEAIREINTVIVLLASSFGCGHLLFDKLPAKHKKYSGSGWRVEKK